MTQDRFENDALPGWRLVGISGMVVLIMVVAVAWSVHLDGHGVAQLGPAPAPSARAAIEADLISAADAPAVVRAQQARLSQYAWVDRAHGIVAIPIDQAIELYLLRSR